MVMPNAPGAQMSGRLRCVQASDARACIRIYKYRCVRNVHIGRVHWACIRQITAQRFSKVHITEHFWHLLQYSLSIVFGTSYCLQWSPTSWIGRPAHGYIRFPIETSDPPNNQVCAIITVQWRGVYTQRVRGGQIQLLRDDGYSYASSDLVFMSSHTDFHIHHTSSKLDNPWKHL